MLFLALSKRQSYERLPVPSQEQRKDVVSSGFSSDGFFLPHCRRLYLLAWQTPGFRVG